MLIDYDLFASVAITVALCMFLSSLDAIHLPHAEETHAKGDRDRFPFHLGVL